MCGGTGLGVWRGCPTRGLSPRVRGNPGRPRRRPGGDGSIPACAGEPRRRPRGTAATRVYPRVCGGTGIWIVPLAAACGLSPRVRGNPEFPAPRRRPGGSIPACAGEPSPARCAARQRRVYPRVCGGTHDYVARLTDAEGLSPRVRGNPADVGARRPKGGSIPACAGEPRPPCSRPPVRRVYPRVCGGTQRCGISTARLGGLSPRVRGNPAHPAPRRRRIGSIPACAGEPSRASAAPSGPRVYPRVCGGTRAFAHWTQYRAGLSPRVRGNPEQRPARRGRSGSIPACAGEPTSASSGRSRRWVYPRVCGGTRLTSTVLSNLRGLSPRVRGNPRLARHHPRRAGSIPACAGEPPRRRPGRCLPRVYPRVCGGTLLVPSACSPCVGLSPRVRGNLTSPSRRWSGWGSIPACAGEPVSIPSAM